MFDEKTLSKLISNNEAGMTYIWEIADSGFVPNDILTAALNQPVSEDPKPLEVLGMLVLESLVSYKLNKSYVSMVNASDKIVPPSVVRPIIAEINQLIGDEQYDEAQEKIQRAVAMFGQFPELSVCQAEISMIDALSRSV